MEAPSLHSNDSCPSHDDVGGFFFEFEAVRTPRCSAQAKQLDLLQAEVDQEEQLFGDEQLTAEEKQQHELSKKILAMVGMRRPTSGGESYTPSRRRRGGSGRRRRVGYSRGRGDGVGGRATSRADGV